METADTDRGMLDNGAGNARLAGFLTLAPVLLRAQSRRVVAELVVTAGADLIGELTFNGLWLADFPARGCPLTAYRQRLLATSEAQAIFNQLPTRFLEEVETSTLLKSDQLESQLSILLNSTYLYVEPVHTPTRRFGCFLGGSHHQLSQEDRQYLRSLAELTAIALDNAMRFDDLKEAAHEMSLVNEMAGSLAASLNGEELFNSFMARLQDIVPVKQSNLILIAPLGQAFSLPFNWTDPPGHSQRTYLKNVPLAGTPFDEAIRRQEILAGFWKMDFGEEDASIFREANASQLIIPLFAKKQIVGIVALGTPEEFVYQEDRLRRSLVEKMAGLFALALLNSRMYEEKQLSAEFDSRIGVYNHDYFDRELAIQIQKARRNDYRLGLMMVDMDNLKVVNDKHGHLTGTEALRHIATLITRTVRATDVVARYGGDEFGVMLPGCTPLGLEIVAEKTRRAIRNTPLILEDGSELRLSVSIGAVIYPEDASSPRDLIQQADAALYVSKKHRDQVRIGTHARLPLVTETDLGSTEHLELPALPEALGEVSVDYERFLMWLSGNRSDIEGRVINELNERLVDSQRMLQEATSRVTRLEDVLWRGLGLVAEVIERREPYLSGGALKLVRLVQLLCRQFNIAEFDRRGLEAAAWISNLGRLAIPELIWSHPGPLSEENWKRIYQTPLEATRMASMLDALLPETTLIALRYQREHFDGTGYPLRIAGEEIPLAARLLGVSSALVAMTQKRPHRDKLERAGCRHQLEQGAGRQFDAQLTGVLLELLNNGSLEFLDFS